MPDNLTLSDSIVQHINDSMVLAVTAERHPLWKYACPELTDIDFIRLSLHRTISAVDSGRHFLKVTSYIHNEKIPLTTYFKSLTSSRRAKMLKAVERQSYQLLSKVLQEQGVDYLQSYSELTGYRVEAADGHFIEHASHTRISSFTIRTAQSAIITGRSLVDVLHHDRH